MENSNQEPQIDASTDGAEFTRRLTGLGCFKCDGELEIANINGFKIAGCRDCHGLLIQTRLFGAMTNYRRAFYEGDETVPAPLKPADLQQATVCNACGNMMDTHAYCGPGNVVIDSCHHCKMVWLDAKELQQIVEAPGRREYEPVELGTFEPELQKEMYRGLPEVDGTLTAAEALAWILG